MTSINSTPMSNLRKHSICAWRAELSLNFRISKFRLQPSNGWYQNIMQMILQASLSCYLHQPYREKNRCDKNSGRLPDFLMATSLKNLPSTALVNLKLPSRKLEFFRWMFCKWCSGFDLFEEVAVLLCSSMIYFANVLGEFLKFSES